MKRIISLLLVILLLGTVLIGCKKDKEEGPANSNPSSGTEEEFFPVIEKQDAWNGKDFNIMYPMWSLYSGFSSVI